MLFSSPTFLFVFLPAFLVLFWFLPAVRRSLLLGSSLLFYGWSEPIFLGVVLCSAGLDYLLGARLTRLPAESPVRERLVTIGVVGNVGILVVVKYTGFLVENCNAVAAWVGLPACPVPRIALPLAVSFIVFEKITYLVDLNRRAAPPASSFMNYLSYVFLFPKLLAGPIVRYRDLAAQLAAPSTPRFEDVRDGLLRFVQGLSKKVLLADPLGSFVDPIFAQPADTLTPSAAWLGIVSFMLQIYFDFSGYSDMAIGMGRVFGFRLRENFNQPYLATSFTDFWRRWHISLGSWVQQYLYRPLGGRRRVSEARGHVNSMICMLVIGLWHGASWTFVCWGLYHGLALAADHAFWLRWQQRLPRLVNIVLTIFPLTLSGVFFRCPTLARAADYFATLAGQAAPSPQPGILPPDIQAVLLVSTALVVAPMFRRPVPAGVSFDPAPAHRIPALAGGLALLMWSLGRVAVNTFHPFLYFRY